jgi:hypothetical protein
MCREPAGDCQTRGPKAWTDDEVPLVSAALDAIDARPLGRLVLDRDALQGVTTRRRFSSGGASRPKDPLGIGSTAVRPTSAAHAIDIHDSYFSYRGVRDRFSGQPGYLLTAEILLHECFHVLDDGTGGLAIAHLAACPEPGAPVGPSRRACTRYTARDRRLSTRALSPEANNKNDAGSGMGAGALS